MKFSKILAIVAIFSVGVLTSGCSPAMVDTGNVGLVINHYSGNIEKVYDAGYHGQLPLSGRELIEIPTYKQTYNMIMGSTEEGHEGDDSIAVNTLSSNKLNVDASFEFYIIGNTPDQKLTKEQIDQIKALYTKYRTTFRNGGFEKFQEEQLRPVMRAAVSDAFGLASTTQNMTGTGKMAAAEYAKNELNKRYNPDGIFFSEVRIRGARPDAEAAVALRSRLVAQQELRISKLNKTLQDKLNTIKVSKAQAEAKATQIRARSLSPKLMVANHIENWQIIGVPRNAIIQTGPSGVEVKEEKTEEQPAP